MKIEQKKVLKVELEDTDSTNFKSIIQKLNGEVKRAGFDRFNFSDDESKLIKDLSEKINK